MNCNCINNNNAENSVKLRHVFGNVLRLALPLTLRIVTIENGEATSTDTDFIPSSEHPVQMVFTKGAGAKRIALDATMRDGNIACIEDRGTIPVGEYDITILCTGTDGRPYRFKQNTVLYVVDTTAEAGILQPDEFETKEWYLDAAIFMQMRGEDGVGIDDIQTESSGEIGGVNRITIVLSDGRTKQFTIMNGSGTVDNEFSESSLHPLSNMLITERFNTVDESIASIFGDVDYDSVSKSIRFYNKGKTAVLATLDAKPFIKDGMVNSVYISNNTLVITFNTDSGREAIGVPLTSVFNPNNYYNKTQIDNRIAEAVANVQVDTSKLMTKAGYTYPSVQDSPLGGIIKYDVSARYVLDFIEDIGEMHEVGYGVRFGSSNGHIYVGTDGSQTDLGLAEGHVFLNKDDNNFYSFQNGEWVQAGGSSGAGYNISYSQGNLIFASGSNEPAYSNGNLIL